MVHAARSRPAPLVAGVSFSSLSDNEDRMKKRMECKKLANKGELSQERIMERYTIQIQTRSGEQMQLQEKYEELWRTEHLEGERDRSAFLSCFLFSGHHPRERLIRYISKTRFLASLSAPFGQYSPDIQRGLHILYRVFIQYAQFPFPTSEDLFVTKDACCRGVLFLAGLYEWATQPGTGGPCQCGPYRGNALTHRATTSYDERRRMFRFLVNPVPVFLPEQEATPVDILQITRVPVPQFTYDITPNSSPERYSGYSSTADRVIIQDNEDEREVDLLDVLLETYPSTQDAQTSNMDESSVTNGPYRDSFRFVIPTLPRPEKTLHQLNITFSDWKAFVELLLVSSFGICPTHLGPMFEHSRVLEYVLDAMCFAFVEERHDALDWKAFNTVIPRSMPALFRNPPDDGLTNLFRPFLRPQTGMVGDTNLISGIPDTILSYPRLAQLRTFVEPFSRCKFFFGSHRRMVNFKTMNEFRAWKGHRYIFISGYEINRDSPFPLTPETSPASQKLFVGMTIHGPVIGPDGSRPSRENNSECAIQAFQLSPEHRVYGFEPYRLRLDPMMSLKFGIQNDNWEMAARPTGYTRIAFMEDVNECLFEHGKPNHPDELQRWVPFGRGSPGVRRITVEAWEVWGFDQVQG